MLGWVTAMGQRKGMRIFPSLPFSLVGLLWRVLTGRCCARRSIQIWKRWQGRRNAKELSSSMLASCDFLSGRGVTHSVPRYCHKGGCHTRLARQRVTPSDRANGKGLNQLSYDLGTDEKLFWSKPAEAINATIEKLVSPRSKAAFFVK